MAMAMRGCTSSAASSEPHVRRDVVDRDPANARALAPDVERAVDVPRPDRAAVARGEHQLIPLLPYLAGLDVLGAALGVTAAALLAGGTVVGRITAGRCCGPGCASSA
jgi:hypothetical protein